MTPTTEAGRRLLDDEMHVRLTLAIGGDAMTTEDEFAAAILAIEAEAREQEAQKWRQLFDDEKYGLRRARREADEKVADLAARIIAAVKKMTYAEGAPSDGSAESIFEAEGFEWCQQRVLALIAEARR